MPSREFHGQREYLSIQKEESQQLRHPEEKYVLTTFNYMCYMRLGHIHDVNLDEILACPTSTFRQAGIFWIIKTSLPKFISESAEFMVHQQPRIKAIETETRGSGLSSARDICGVYNFPKFPKN